MKDVVCSIPKDPAMAVVSTLLAEESMLCSGWAMLSKHGTSSLAKSLRISTVAVLGRRVGEHLPQIGEAVTLDN